MTPDRSAARFRSLPVPLVDGTADRRWVEHAVCAGQRELFLEGSGERPGARHRREVAAKGICGCCPVRADCLDAGRRNHESGIWGGETNEERAAAGYSPRGIVLRGVVADGTAADTRAPDGPGAGEAA